MKPGRQCRKCGSKIPLKIKIDGKERNLRNRKFCLACSPFGSRNTKKDDPSRPAKKRGAYKTWDEETKKRFRKYVLERGHKIKRRLIEEKGGKCQKCGYSSTILRTMTFHHVNPPEKKFNLCVNNLWVRSKQVIDEEAKKCTLLCIRCHMELEGEVKH